MRRTYLCYNHDMNRRFDLRAFLCIAGAALLGLAWALYNRSQGMIKIPYTEEEFRPLVWVIFAIPFATFWGWLLVRPAERWWAAFVCFCIYFFSPFVAARYESCTVLSGAFSLNSCFLETANAQQAANSQGHVIYFGAIVIIQIVAALTVALQRALSRSTIPGYTPLPQQEPS